MFVSTTQTFLLLSWTEVELPPPTDVCCLLLLFLLLLLEPALQKVLAALYSCTTKCGSVFFGGKLQCNCHANGNPGCAQSRMELLRMWMGIIKRKQHMHISTCVNLT